MQYRSRYVLTLQLHERITTKGCVPARVNFDCIKEIDKDLTCILLKYTTSIYSTLHLAYVVA